MYFPFIDNQNQVIFTGARILIQHGPLAGFI